MGIRGTVVLFDILSAPARSEFTGVVDMSARSGTAITGMWI
jgi:hypothetical protein